MDLDIEDLDDLTAYLKGVGDVDGVLEEARNARRERRLAVAGRPIQEDAASGVDRRQQPANHRFRNDETGEAIAELRLLHHLVGDALLFDLFAIGDQGHRRRPDIARARKALRWAPRVALSDGLRRTIAYFRQALEK